MELLFEKIGVIFKFDMVGTIMVGLVSLYFGKKLKNKLTFLNKFGIPAAVLGGLLFAIFHLLLRVSKVGEISYDTGFQTAFMIVFFTTIGLGSSIEGLKKGGKILIFFWLLSGVMTFMQTVIGVSIAKITRINPLLGVMAGSVSMSGGHGSAGAFGKTIEELGVNGGLTVALSSATFGLIAGGLLGAPLAIHLIKKYKLTPQNIINKDEINTNSEFQKKNITVNSMLSHITMLSIIMSIGITISLILKKNFGIALPSYVGAMLSAIIFNNLNNKYKWLELDRNLLNIIGETSLNIFLSMALISLKLWELADLAIPLILILMGQVIFMWVYTRFIVFRIMGRDYDAAVMVAGMCGSGLGATTNAMINMEEVSSRYGYTMVPYLLVPLTGAFLIDIFQMPVIITAINLFK